MQEEKIESSEEQTFDLHEMFDKFRSENKTNPLLDDEPIEKPEKPKKQEEETPEEDEEDDEIEAPKKEHKEEGSNYKLELEKTQKTLRDTQKSFHEDRKKLAAYKKAVEKLKEEGTLIEEEANLLLDHTKFEEMSEDEPLLIKYCKVWDKETQYMRRYSSNPKEIDQYSSAFKHFLKTASQEEIDEALDELSALEDDEVEMTKKMLEIGRQYNDDIYSDIYEAGGIRNLKAFYSKKESELQKTVDKLHKQIVKYKQKYEDYDTDPKLKLPSGSGNVDIPKYDKVDLDAFFDKLG